LGYSLVVGHGTLLKREMNISNQLGQLTELWCQMQFCERGIVLSQPTNPSSRYDFIAEIKDKLYRIQCKTAHPETNNRISFTVVTHNWNQSEFHNYIGQIDFFYTHWENKGYLIPIELCTETNKNKFIRLGEPNTYSSNNLNAIYGKDYEIDKILGMIDESILNNYITIESPERKEKVLEKVNKCIKCGKPITSQAIKCWDCYKKSIHPEDKPTREELKKLIRELPFTKIGELYGRTDNAIRKWCDSYSLPRKKDDIKKISDEDWLKI